MNNISLVTFAAMTVTPQDDALVYESALGAGGIIYGGEVTVKNANTLHINTGHGIICGRKFTIYDSDIPVTLSSAGDLLGRLYIHLDLSNASDPIEILVETGQSLSPLVQDEDVNIVNGIYDVNIATFNVSTSTVSDLRNVYPKVLYANSGSLIRITTQESSLIGEEVTVTDGTDYVYAVFNAEGVAELTNVLMTGTLQISATNGTDVATASINVPYYGSYEMSLAFWNATLYMTTPNSELYGQQITITDSSDVVVGTTSFGGSGTASFVVKEPDTYTASVTYGGNTFSESANVTAQETYNLTITLIPDGATVTPTDVIQTWLQCAGIFNKTYTTISQVLADSTSLLALISDTNAVDYMARSTTWANSVVANSTAMGYIGNNDYCANKLLSNSTWLNAICNSTYFESVLNVKVPTMTSATTPSGEVIASGSYNTYNDWAPWKTFKGLTAGNQTSDCVEYTHSGTRFVAYKFTSANKSWLCRFTTYGLQLTTLAPNIFFVDGSNDGSNWTNVSNGEITLNKTVSATTIQSALLHPSQKYQYYRVRWESSGQFGRAQFYGRA